MLESEWNRKLPEFGKFAEPSLLILVSLSDGPKHGYAIMQDVEHGTGRPMGAGTLYAALARLEEQGPRRTAAPGRPPPAVSPHRGRGHRCSPSSSAACPQFAQLGLRQLGETPP